VKTAIVGAGALGSLVGGLLAESGAEVWLIDLDQEHVSAVNSRGLTIERCGVSRTIRVAATTDPDQAGATELVIILVKSMDTASAVDVAARIADRGAPVLSLQNGLGNAEIIADRFDPDCVLAGTTSLGATRLAPGGVRHAGTGDTVVGAWSPAGESAARRVVDFLRSAGLRVSCEKHILDHLWDKLFVSVGVNAITALTGVKNGGLVERAETRELVTAAVEEAVAVARAAGRTIRRDPLGHVFDVIGATADNRSSMGQDVDNRRPTEISAINGAVVREAEELGVDVPVNRALTTLIETLEANY
jgi:2-dehydropantoate 2-reductase